VLLWILNVWLGGMLALQIKLDKRVQEVGSLRKWQTSISISLLILMTGSTVIVFGSPFAVEAISMIWTGFTYTAMLTIYPMLFKQFSVVAKTRSGSLFGVSVTILSLGGMFYDSQVGLIMPLSGTIVMMMLYMGYLGLHQK
jgi:hypothetical protein